MTACSQAITETTIMKNVRQSVILVSGTAVAGLIAGTLFLTISRPAAATTTFAAQTGKPCAQCHQHPTGGPALTPYGEKYRANGNELPK
jgi:hypothetical protein